MWTSAMMAKIADAIQVKGLVLSIETSPFVVLILILNQPSGEPQRHENPQHAEGPASDHVARPVNAEHHAARADRHRKENCAGGGNAMPLRPCGQSKGHRQVEDHR